MSAKKKQQNKSTNQAATVTAAAAVKPNLYSSKEIKSTMIHRCFVFIFVAVVFCYLVTRCSVQYMTPQSTALLMAGLWVFLGFYLASCLDAQRWHVVLAASSGVLAYFVFEIVADMAMERGESLGMYGEEGNLIRVVFWGGVAMLLFVLFALLIVKRLTYRDGVLLIMMLSFWTRLTIVLYTPVTHMFQHDMAFFDDTFYGTHDTYILYIYNNWRLLDADVRGLAQFYHPPLHYFLAAVVLKVNSWIFPAQADNFECIKLIPLFCTTGTTLIVYKIIRYFKISGTGVFMAMLSCLFLPEFLFLGASVNNDALCVFFAFLSLYLALLWYRKPKLSGILPIAVTIGCSMMSKLSGGFIAIPIALLFLVRFVKSFKKDGPSVPNLIGQFAMFAVVVFPLGLWYPIRNHIKWGVPFTYINQFKVSVVQDISMYSVFERIFAIPEGLSTAVPFVLFNADAKDYNTTLALLKTALFDERMFQQNQIFLAMGSLMLILFGILAFCSVVAICVFTVVDWRRGTYRWESLALTVLFVTQIVMYNIFCIKYPLVCTMNFRYVMPVAIPCFYAMARGIGALGRRRKKSLLAGLAFYGVCAVIVCFSVLSLLFYGNWWAYYVHTGASLYD